MKCNLPYNVIVQITSYPVRAISTFATNIFDRNLVLRNVLPLRISIRERFNYRILYFFFAPFCRVFESFWLFIDVLKNEILLIEPRIIYIFLCDVKNLTYIVFECLHYFHVYLWTVNSFILGFSFYNNTHFFRCMFRSNASISTAMAAIFILFL